MERTVTLGVARTPFDESGGTLSPLITPGLGGAEILRHRGGDSDLVAICSGGGQGDTVLVGV